ncbi:unnamed protein product [Caenorhabditis auriculariae]|uniref:EGF-like domain-containing protein n=1 Tax=Caenorhabditis auriculariae TaxID=2777116 RepID=A0A8S1HAS2_9PELO|nr:unnamed protein product [Caenorhabditis auriculariae]
MFEVSTSAGSSSTASTSSSIKTSSTGKPISSKKSTTTTTPSTKLPTTTLPVETSIHTTKTSTRSITTSSTAKITKVPTETAAESSEPTITLKKSTSFEKSTTAATPKTTKKVDTTYTTEMRTPTFSTTSEKVQSTSTIEATTDTSSKPSENLEMTSAAEPTKVTTSDTSKVGTKSSSVSTEEITSSTTSEYVGTTSSKEATVATASTSTEKVETTSSTEATMAKLSTESMKDKTKTSSETSTRNKSTTKTTTTPKKVTQTEKSTKNASSSTTRKKSETTTEKPATPHTKKISTTSTISKKTTTATKTTMPSTTPEKVATTSEKKISPTPKKSSTTSKTPKNVVTTTEKKISTTTKKSSEPSTTSKKVVTTSEKKISTTTKKSSKPSTTSKKVVTTAASRSTASSATSMKVPLSEKPTTSPTKPVTSTSATSTGTVSTTAKTTKTTTDDVKASSTIASSTTTEKATTRQLESTRSWATACPEGATEGPLFCYLAVPDGRSNSSYLKVKSACNRIFGSDSSIISLYELMDPVTLKLFKNMTGEKNTTVFWAEGGGSRTQWNRLALRINSDAAPEFFQGEGIDKVPIYNEDNTVGGICKVPKYGAAMECATDTFHEALYLRGKFNLPQAGKFVAVGNRITSSCSLPNCYEPNWTFLCNPKGVWSPHPDAVNCTQRRGTLWVDTARPFYGREQEKCQNCVEEGTATCNATDNGTFVCVCKPGYTGFRCQKVPQWCGTDSQAAALCIMGRCVNERNSYRCICDYAIGEDHCTWNRSHFEFDRRGWMSSTQTTSTTAVVALVTWFFFWSFVAQSDRTYNARDRQNTIQMLRGFATLTMMTIFAGFRNPGMLGDWQACPVWYFIFTWMHTTIGIFWTVESVCYGSMLRNHHRNGFHTWNGQKPSTLVFMFCLFGPFFVGFFWAGTVVFVVAGSLVQAASTWSCIGYNTDTIVPNLYLLPLFVFPAFGYRKWAEGSTAVRYEYRRRLRAWFTVFSPRNVDFYSRVLRNGPMLDLMPFAYALQYIAMVYHVAEPENDQYRTLSAVAIAINTVLHWVQFAVTAPPLWNFVCNKMMVHLPSHVAPKFNTVMRWTRDEVLCWKAPLKYATEFEEKLELENERRKMEVERAIQKRNKMLERCPTIDLRLLPAVPVFLEAEAPAEHLAKLTPNGIEGPEDYLSDFSLEVIRTRFFVNYIKERLDSRCERTHCAFRVVAREWVQVGYDQSQIAYHQLIRLFKQCCDIVRDNDYLLFEGEKPGMDPLKMNRPLAKCFEITQRFRRRKNAPPANTTEAVKKYERMLESIGYRYPVDDFKSIFYSDVAEDYETFIAGTHFVSRMPYIHTIKELEKRLEIFAEQAKEENAIWDHIYDDDDWFVERSEEEKEALRKEYKIVDSQQFPNPRKMKLKHLHDRYFDQIRPGFIGPKTPNASIYPDFGGLFSSDKFWLEEADEKAFNSFIEMKEWRKSDKELYEKYRKDLLKPKEKKHKPPLRDVGEETGLRQRFKNHLRK